MTVSQLKRLKRTLNYEPSVPRCELCVKYSKPGMYMVRDSLPRSTPAHCKTNGFTVEPCGVCDAWADKKTGETL